MTNSIMALFDELAQASHGKNYQDLTAEEQDTVLHDLAENIVRYAPGSTAMLLDLTAPKPPSYEDRTTREASLAQQLRLQN